MPPKGTVRGGRSLPWPFPPPGYHRWNQDGRDIVAAGDVAEAVGAALALAPSLHAWARDRAERVREAGRGTIYVVRLGAVRSAVRHAKRGGWMARLLGDRYFDRPPRPHRELAVSERLRRADVSTPRVLAALVLPAGAGYRADLATEWLEPGHDLAALLAPGAYPAPVRRAALAAAGRAVGRAHAAGLDHPDLNVTNLFVLPGPVGTWRAVLLDLDRARLAPPPAAIDRNLERFERSLAKERRAGRIGWDEDDLSTFLEAHRSALDEGGSLLDDREHA